MYLTAVCMYSSPADPVDYSLYKGYMQLAGGLSVGLCGLAAGMAIGIVGMCRIVIIVDLLCFVLYYINYIQVTPECAPMLSRRRCSLEWS